MIKMLLQRTRLGRYAMRACAVALCSAALCGVPAMAQSDDPAPPIRVQSAYQRIAALEKAVPLTDDQKSKITDLYDLNFRKMQNLLAAHNPDMRTKMQDLRDEENRQVLEMMTGEQRPKFIAFAEAQRKLGL